MNSYNKFLVFALVLFIGLGVVCAAGVDDAGMDDATDSSSVSEVVSETSMDNGNLPVEDDVGDNTDPGANPTQYDSIEERTYNNSIITLSGDQSFTDGVATFGSNVTLTSDDTTRTLGNFKIVVSGNNVTINNVVFNHQTSSATKVIDVTGGASNVLINDTVITLTKNNAVTTMAINIDNNADNVVVNNSSITVNGVAQTLWHQDENNIKWDNEEEIKIINVTDSSTEYLYLTESGTYKIYAPYLSDILISRINITIIDTYLPYVDYRLARANVTFINSTFLYQSNSGAGGSTVTFINSTNVIDNVKTFVMCNNVRPSYGQIYYDTYFDTSSNMLLSSVPDGATIVIRKIPDAVYNNPMIINKPINITSFNGAIYSADITFVAGSEGSNITGLTLNGNLYINTSNIGVKNTTINKGVFVNEGSGVVIEENTFNTDETAVVLVGAVDNTIQNNNITTTSEYTITLDADSVENTITGNNLQAATLAGVASVHDEGEDNTITDGGDEPVVVEPELRIDTTEFTVGNAATITASIYKGDEVDSTISKGKVVFKVNGKTLKDTNGKVIYAKVTGGVATITDYEVPSSWAKDNITIQAVYSGSSQCDALRTESNLTVSKDSPAITTSDVTASKGETVTLTATVSEGNAPVNVGKVVFKVNGKTVKDTNGKVIYAKVVNGTVSVEYTLPENMKAGNYNITVSFTAPGYDKLVDTKTLTVSA